MSSVILQGHAELIEIGEFTHGKTVQLGFSLIKNRAPHGTGLLCLLETWELNRHQESVQIPGFWTDSWFLEPNGKMVQLGFSLIKNRAPQTKWHKY
jgi:hypothetical protein